MDRPKAAEISSTVAFCSVVTSSSDLFDENLATVITVTTVFENGETGPMGGRAQGKGWVEGEQLTDHTDCGEQKTTWLRSTRVYNTENINQL